MRWKAWSVLLLVTCLVASIPAASDAGENAIRVRITGMPKNHNVTKSMVCPPGTLPCDNDCMWNLTISAVLEGSIGIKGAEGRVDFGSEPLTFDPPLSSCTTTRTTVSFTRDFTVACPGTHNGVNEDQFFIDFDAYGCGPPTAPGYGYDYMRLKLKCYYCSNDAFVAVDGNGTTDVGYADHEQNAVVQFSVLNLDESTALVTLIPMPPAAFAYYPAFPPSTSLGPGESKEFLVTVVIPAGMPPGTMGLFTLNAYGADGLWVSDSDTILVTEYTDAGDAAAVPPAFDLHNNYPNPFNPRTEISFSLPGPSAVTIEIFDVSGKRVRRLIDGNLPAGPHSVAWDGLGEDGTQAASGVYFYLLTADGHRLSRKMVLLR